MTLKVLLALVAGCLLLDALVLYGFVWLVQTHGLAGVLSGAVGIAVIIAALFVISDQYHEMRERVR